MGIRAKEQARKNNGIVSVIAGIEDEKKLGRPRSDKENKKTVSITIEPSIWSDLQDIARLQGISASTLISNISKKLIEEKQEQLESYKKLK